MPIESNRRQVLRDEVYATSSSYMDHTMKERAVELADKHFNGLNHQAAAQRGIHEALYGDIIPFFLPTK